MSKYDILTYSKNRMKVTISLSICNTLESKKCRFCLNFSIVSLKFHLWKAFAVINCKLVVVMMGKRAKIRKSLDCWSISFFILHLNRPYIDHSFQKYAYALILSAHLFIILWVFFLFLFPLVLVGNVFFFLNLPKNINSRKLLDAVMINSHKWKSTATQRNKQNRNSSDQTLLWCARTKAIKNTHRFHNRKFLGFPIVFNRFERLFISSPGPTHNTRCHQTVADIQKQ